MRFDHIIDHIRRNNSTTPMSGAVWQAYRIRRSLRGDYCNWTTASL